MKTLRITLMMTALALLIAFGATGCGDDSKSDAKSKSVTEQVVDDFVESTFTTAQVETVETPATRDNIEPVEPMITLDTTEATVYGLVAHDKIIYALTPDGVVAYNLKDGSDRLISGEKPMQAILALGGEIFLGGDNIYTLDENGISESDYIFPEDVQITVLQPHRNTLLVGATDGLYQVTAEGVHRVAEDMNVSAIASDWVGAWVGTAGDGLYYWNGVSFKKRFLSRDESLFDNVTALTFGHNHLYLGTDKGLFDYDGGRWQQYTITDGLPSNRITAINASDWVLKIGTVAGAVTMHEGVIEPLSRLETLAVSGFVTGDHKLFAATINGGLVMKSGGVLSTLYDGPGAPPQVAMEPEEQSAIPEEIVQQAALEIQEPMVLEQEGQEAIPEEEEQSIGSENEGQQVSLEGEAQQAAPEPAKRQIGLVEDEQQADLGKGE